MVPSEVVVQRVARGVHRVEKVLSSGWCRNMLIVELREGVLVHSPTWLGDEGFAAIEAIGRPTVLFAPNHFHHLSLARYRERYPDALACASPSALPGLAARGHAGVLSVEDATGLLPSGARFLCCEGTKAGEAWIAVVGDGGPTLLVCDAFFNVERPVTGGMGLALRALKTVPGLCIGRTFPWLALRDSAKYVAWATAAIGELRPACLVPSHGEAVHDADLSKRLDALIRERLG